MNKSFNKRALHHFVMLGLVAIFLWGVVAYGWYVAYLWIAPVPASSFIFTFVVLPIPFIVCRLVARSRWATQLSESVLINRIQPLLVFTRYVIGSLLVVGILISVVPRLVTANYVGAFTFELANVSPRRVALVFGAGLLPDGSLSPLLRKRVETAAELYEAGKVEKILMSGDNRFVDYNEPAAMREYALSLGVPDNAVVLDYAGRRTYDTCYRARVIFGVADAILVTQDYHLARAIYTCRVLGIEALGVAAKNNTSYLSLPILANVRESLATWEAFWELYVSHPIPVLGKPEPIFSSPGK